MSRVILARLAAVVAAPAADAAPPTETSIVEEHGVRITFTPACVDGDIYLRGTLRNVSKGTLRLDPALVPWRADPISTKFVVKSRGKVLKFGGVFPTISVTAPIELKPGEQREGVTPVGHMFPDIRAALAAGPVNIRWTYPMPLAGSQPISVSGEMVLSKNPCSAQK